MIPSRPSDFKHTTATVYPDKIVAYVFLDEEPGFTGIYAKNERGELWPCRTVQIGAPHYDSVIAAWSSK